MDETETQDDMECKELEKAIDDAIQRIKTMSNEMERIEQEMANEQIEHLKQMQKAVEILSKLLPIAMAGFIVVIVLTMIATILTTI